jgi:hypothetical protein
MCVNIFTKLLLFVLFSIPTVGNFKSIEAYKFQSDNTCEVYDKKV